MGTPMARLDARSSRIAATALLLAAAGTGCGALDEFDVTIEDTATIPGTVGANQPFSPMYGGGFNGLDLSGDKTFQNNDVDPDDVDAIFVKSVRLEDSMPELKNLANVVEMVELFVEAEGLPKQRIAMGSNFADAAFAELTIDQGVNLKPYAVKPQMTVSAQIRLKQRPAFTFNLRTVVTLLVDIDLLGA